MLTKIVLKKETSAILIAIVLVLGTIATVNPSFIAGAQATSDREKDYDHDEYKKSYDKDDYKSEYSSYGKYEDRDHDKYNKDSSSSVSIKKVKCNNINVNLNGIDVNIGGLPNNGPVTDPVAVAKEDDDDDDDDEEIESNSIESDKHESYNGRDGKSDSNTNSRIVCINNNNNIVGEEREPTCEDCFTTVLTDKEELDDLIQAIEELSGGEVSSLEEFCDFIDDISGIEDGPAIISQVLFELGEEVGISDSDDKINEILDCLEEVFNVDFPREIIV